MTYPSMTLPSVETLALAFKTEMSRALTKEILTRIDEGNTGKALWCASHDFIDSNMVMLAAIQTAMPGMSEDEAIAELSKDSQLSNLVNEAWTLAKETGFASMSLAHPLVYNLTLTQSQFLALKGLLEFHEADDLDDFGPGMEDLLHQMRAGDYHLTKG